MNAKFSGCSVVTILLLESRLACAHVGDTRALLVRRVNGSWTIIQLSSDHVPSVPAEKDRIVRCGGRVFPHEDEKNGRSRVWLKTKFGPGLAMSRSLGDSVVSRVGVICEPGVFEIDLTPEDKFFLLATDGVWDVMSNEEVVECIDYYVSRCDGEGAISALTEEANRRYMEETGRTDDVTIVLGFLNIKNEPLSLRDENALPDGGIYNSNTDRERSIKPPSIPWYDAEVIVT